jgi:hypothetical protein
MSCVEIAFYEVYDGASAIGVLFLSFLLRLPDASNLNAFLMYFRVLYIP